MQLRLFDKEGNITNPPLAKLAKVADITSTPILLLIILFGDRLPNGWRNALLAIWIPLVLIGLWVNGVRLYKFRWDADAWKFAARYLAPVAAAAATAFGVGILVHAETNHDIMLLTICALVPLIVSMIRATFNDQHDRTVNTSNVIKTQYFALPLIPVAYLALKAFWPAQASPFLLILAIFALLIAARLSNTPQKAWLIKERFQIIHYKLRQEGAPEPLLLLDCSDAKRELSNFVVKSSDLRDHVDLADAYIELGKVQEFLQNRTEAELSYSAGVDKYETLVALQPTDEGLRLKKEDAQQLLDRVRTQSS